MPRRQLIVMGLRCHSVPSGCGRRAVAQAAVGARKLHNSAVAHKWYIPSFYKSKGSSKGTSAGAQQRPMPPPSTESFAASAVSQRAAAAAKHGSLLRAAAPGVAPPTSPSFAATPLWGSRAAQLAPPPAATPPSHGMPTLPTPRGVPAAVKANPLYRFAKLDDGPASSSKVPTSPLESNSNALLQFARLGAPKAAKQVASKLSDAAALLRFAKMGPK